MFPLVEKWQTSGQSQKQFCLDYSIKYHTFAYGLNAISNTNIAWMDLRPLQLLGVWIHVRLRFGVQAGR